MILAGLLFVIQASCFHNSFRNQRRWRTGTCTGACAYYAHCKEMRNEPISDEVRAACLAECDEVFSSSESLLLYEGLVCDDAIAFIEGSNGREPGEPVREKRPQRANNVSN